MMADDKKVPIDYTARDFNSIKKELVNYVKRYYPETFRDFNEASFGSLMLDTVSYIGDMLWFYLDYQVNESFLDTAIEYDNVIRLAKQMGFKLSTNPSSSGIIEFYITVPANSSGLGPDTAYLPILKKGSVFSTENVTFILTEDVNFANVNAEVVVAKVDNTSGIPLSYAIRMKAKVISGNLVRDVTEVEDYSRFKTISLNSPNVSEIVSVYDSDGNEYYQVDYLSQDVIYKEVNNSASDNELVPNVLRPFAVPRRFTLESEGNNYFLQFGYGSDAESAKLQPVEPSNVVLDIFSKGYISDDSFDPSKLIEGDKFGIVPQNTTLTVVYRVNNVDNVNAAVGAVKKVVTPLFSYANRQSLNENVISSVSDSLQVYNPNPIVGDVSLPTSEEIRKRTYHFFATQNRAVTKKDYEAILYGMPSKFGAVKRCNVLQDLDSFKRNLNIYVLAEGTGGKLSTATPTLKENIKTWLSQYKMINDTLDILDGSIINFGINFEIIVDKDKNKFDVLNQCNSEVASLYTEPLMFGQQIKITDIYKTLNNITGVVDTKNVKIVFKDGTNYSSVGSYTTVSELMSADGRYVACPKNVVYELKFPTQDIKGAVV
tara:strand:+ start:1093 stop:2895 length:1803 start_codon:yes stop_codon:yes gene_type:complete